MADTPGPSPKTFSIRPPKSTSSPTPQSTTFTPPARSWIEGTWYVTHSSLPLWNDKRNVTITYDLLPDDKVKDTTTYQAQSAGSKVKTISGINTPPPDNPGAYDWRGTGWLKIATSHWEILGWGDVPGAERSEEAGGAGEGKGEEEGHRWLVTYFSKTLFTPAGIDVYSRRREGLPESAVEGIKKTLSDLEAPEVRKLVGEAFEVKHDSEEK